MTPTDQKNDPPKTIEEVTDLLKKIMPSDAWKVTAFIIVGVTEKESKLTLGFNEALIKRKSK